MPHKKIATCRVCLFCKAPIPGKAKTRLSSFLGTRAASTLARALLLDSLDTWKAMENAVEIVYTGCFDSTLLSVINNFPTSRQGDGDLGKKMEQALSRTLQQFDVAVVVGTDIPGIGPNDIEKVLESLQTHDAVLGPSRDGGFYLLALRTCPKGLLSGIPWSSPNTMARTMEQLNNAGIRVALLPHRFDIDIPKDLNTLTNYLHEHPQSMPHTRSFMNSEDGQSISVVIPILNEEARIGELLKNLQKEDGIAEIIVVDGGSDDRSIQIVSTFPEVQLLKSAPGRSTQMNAGAQAARGSTLLFLHADVRLPSGAARKIAESMSNEVYDAGAFRTRTEYDPKSKQRAWIRPFFILADLRSRYSKLPYGDQAIFVKKRTFQTIGGFPAIPLFEDLALSIKLHRASPLNIINSSVRVSGRRFQQRPFYYLALMNSFPLLYRLGVPPRWLASFYKHTR